MLAGSTGDMPALHTSLGCSGLRAQVNWSPGAHCHHRGSSENFPKCIGSGLVAGLHPQRRPEVRSYCLAAVALGLGVQGSVPLPTQVRWAGKVTGGLVCAQGLRTFPDSAAKRGIIPDRVVPLSEDGGGELRGRTPSSWPVGFQGWGP